MKEALEQISHIDSVIHELEQKNNAFLENERARYEEDIKNYRIRQLKAAEESSKIFYDNLINSAKLEYESRESEYKGKAEKLRANYFKNESDLLKKIMDRLLAAN